MTKSSMRLEYGKFLVEMGKKYPSLVALEADLKDSTQSVHFQKAYPGRYIQTGIAEQNMVGIAAGLALGGKIPVVHSFACFLSMRSCEQIRTSVAYPRLNVKFIASHGGFSAGTAGTTHHAIEDIAIMRAIPNMVVLAPSDALEMRAAVSEALKWNGPVYVRLSAADSEEVYPKKGGFSIGRSVRLASGNDVAIITTGIMAGCGMAAAGVLKKRGIRAGVVQMASVKPLDEHAVLEAARRTGHIVTVEEHNVLGGLGGAVCEVVCRQAKAKVKVMGVTDNFCPVGSHACIMKEESLTSSDIVKAVLNILKKGGG